LSVEVAATVGGSAADVAETAVDAECHLDFALEEWAGHATDFVAGSRSVADEEVVVVRSHFVDLHEVLKQLAEVVVLSPSRHLSVEAQ
jgi:hypothetical protein